LAELKEASITFKSAVLEFKDARIAFGSVDAVSGNLMIRMQ
jgi:hypothetical protein